MNQIPTIPKQCSISAASSVPAIQFRSTRKFAGILLAVVLTGFSATGAWAQGDIPSGTVTGFGSGPSYTYDLSFSDGASATSPVGSVWYGWVAPVYNYLPGTPTGASAPSGWTAQISANSIEFFANSSASYIQPGHTLSGFSYTATFTPATLAGDAAAAYSYSYTAGIESDPGVFFSVTTVVPEPSAAALFAMSALGLGLVRWRKLRAKA
jgi:hypothetical protein